MYSTISLDLRVMTVPPLRPCLGNDDAPLARAEETNRTASALPSGQKRGCAFETPARGSIDIGVRKMAVNVSNGPQSCPPIGVQC